MIRLQGDAGQLPLPTQETYARHLNETMQTIATIGLWAGTIALLIYAIKLGRQERSPLPVFIVLAVAAGSIFEPIYDITYHLHWLGADAQGHGPQWTLFWELVANFLHALVLRRVPTRWLPLLAGLMGAWLVYTVGKHGGDTMGVSALTWKTWWMPIPRVFWSYVLGVWLGRIYRGGLRTPALPWPLALALPLAGTMALPYLPLSNVNGDLVFVIAFLPLAMWAVAMTTIPDWLAPKLDELGAFSLPLYCVHLTVLVAVSRLGLGWAWVPVGAAASCAVAWVFHRLVSFRGKPLAVKGPPPA